MFILWMPVLLGLHVLSGAVAQSVSPSYGMQGSDLGLQVFLQMVQKKPHENLVLSPHGVASILGILLPGAHGNTKQQLLSGLRYNKKGERRIDFPLKPLLAYLITFIFLLSVASLVDLLAAEVVY